MSLSQLIARPIWLWCLFFLLLVALQKSITPNTASYFSGSQAITIIPDCLNPTAQNSEQAEQQTCTTQPTLNSAWFTANASGLQFIYTGVGKEQTLFLNDQHGNTTSFELPIKNGVTNHYNFKIPKPLLGQNIQLSTDENAPTNRFSITQLKNSNFEITALIGFVNVVLILLVLHFFMQSLYLLARRYCNETLSLLALPTLLGLFGFIAFWAYYLHVYMGVFVSLLVASLAFYGLLQSDKQTRLSANALLLPISAYTLFIIAISCFPYTLGSADDFHLVANRWRDMPVDAYLPKVFADKIWLSQSVSPLIPTWLSSDRPPLQTGINLLIYPLFKTGFSYQIFSSYLQALVFLPLLVLLRKLNLRAHTFWIILGAMACGFSALNTAFVWPKLISAAYIFICYLLLIYDNITTRRRRIILSGIAATLAMLCHGGAIFGLLPLYLIVSLQGIKHIKSVVLPSGLISLAGYLPWIFYQRVIDPPGDRLLKWHFAGHPAITEQSFWQVLSQAYASLSFNQWVANQMANIQTIYDRAWQIVYWLPEIFKAPFHFPHYEFLHNITFANFFFSFWFLSPLYAFIIYTIAVTFGTKPHTELKTLLQISLLGMGLWIILMFLPKSTGIHQGTYFLWLAFFIISAAMAARIHKLYLIIAVSLNTALFYQFYVMDYVYFQRNGYEHYLIYAISSSVLLLMSLVMLTKSNNRLED